jgi:predicted RecA/RadA family phage recombinase
MGIAKLKRDFGPADSFVWTNSTGSTISAGTPTLIKDTTANKKAKVLIPFTDLANGESGTVYIAGEWTVNKQTSRGFAVGERVRYDNSESVADKVANATDGADFDLGMCTVAAAAGDNYVDLLLNDYPLYS